MGKQAHTLQRIWPFILAVATGVVARSLRFLDTLPIIGDVDYAIIALGIGTAIVVAARVRPAWVAVATPFTWVAAYVLFSMLIEFTRRDPPGETWLNRPFDDFAGGLCVVAGPSLVLIGAILGARHVYLSKWHQLGCCAACGYDLRGSPGPRCPECGAEFTPKTL